MPFSVIPSNSLINLQRATSPTSANIAASATSVSLVTAKERTTLTFFNESNGALLVKYGATAANTPGGWDVKIFPNTIYEFPASVLPPNSAISGIWLNPSSGTLTGSCTVSETL